MRSLRFFQILRRTTKNVIELWMSKDDKKAEILKNLVDFYTESGITKSSGSVTGCGMILNVQL